MHRGAIWLCTTWLGLAATEVAAGAFSVAPIRVEMDSRQRTAVVTLRNMDQAPVMVQANVVAWSQVAGEEVYTPSTDVLVTPPVFTLQPQAEQVVRVALRRPADAKRELAYRLFFQEVPQKAKAAANSLSFSLRVGIPIFVLPQQGAATALQWEVDRLADGKLRFDAVNNGPLHVQVTDFNVSYDGSAETSRAPTSKYVLPGSRVNWVVAPPIGVAAAAAIKLQVSTDRGDADVVPVRIAGQ